jgi:lysophospholipase L1-like esterase
MAGPDHQKPGSSKGWYVALGDSLAAGYQPDTGDHKRAGYVGQVFSTLKDSQPNTKMRTFACSGETSTSLVKGGVCDDYAEGSQLAQARYFLTRHSRSTRLVTLSIGANDVTPCLSDPDTQTCVLTALGALTKNLDRVIGAVHEAAPNARIVTTNYYNPYLAKWFTDPAQAAQTTLLQHLLNSTIKTATKKVHGKTASVARGFHSYAPHKVDGVPFNVGAICSLTWMCTKTNIHPNDAGYAIIAQAVEAKL